MECVSRPRRAIRVRVRTTQRGGVDLDETESMVVSATCSLLYSSIPALCIMRFVMMWQCPIARKAR